MMNNQYQNESLEILSKLLFDQEIQIFARQEIYNRANTSVFNVQKISDRDQYKIVITHNVQEIQSRTVANISYNNKDNKFQIRIIAKIKQNLDKENEIKQQLFEDSFKIEADVDQNYAIMATDHKIEIIFKKNEQNKQL